LLAEATWLENVRIWFQKSVKEERIPTAVKTAHHGKTM
jgi:hypothetical protein